MALSVTLIRAAQRVLGDGPVARWLATIGVARLVRGRRDRAVLARGVHEASLLDHPARFAVSSRTQIEHIDALWREEDMLRRIGAALEDDAVFWDVGGNIGIISLAAALHAPGARVHAFEPEPRNAAALRRNLELNGVAGVELHELALGDSSGSIELFLDPEEGAGSHSLIRREGLGEPVRVRVEPGDAVARDLGAPSVVKIDVEGAEHAVLRGMRGLLEGRRVRDLFLEIHPAQLERGGSSAEALRTWLGERGYVSAWQRRRGDEWHEHYRPGA